MNKPSAVIVVIEWSVGNPSVVGVMKGYRKLVSIGRKVKGCLRGPELRPGPAGEERVKL